MVETVPRPHGEFIGRAKDASAGAIAKPDARTVPAAMQTAARPVRTIPARTVASDRRAGLGRRHRRAPQVIPQS
jgi:hypothetical protein